jgi:NitT/TauT family transport system permease protein
MPEGGAMVKKKSIGHLLKQYGSKIFAICFWLLGWELLSRVLNNNIVLAPPLAVFITLIDLIGQTEFWQTILFSSLRIILGFVLALTGGTILAIISSRFRLVEELISPIMKIIKAMPVASFIILALFWIDVKNLSVLASFMMVVPMFYSNVVQGIKETDEKLLQMAEVFRLGKFKKLTAI